MEAKVANASDTHLPDKSIDVAFLFGIIHSFKNIEPILEEMHRILSENGIIAMQRSSWSEKNLIDRFTHRGLFHPIGKERRIYRFERIGVSPSFGD